jgi:hypothetical protein
VKDTATIDLQFSAEFQNNEDRYAVAHFNLIVPKCWTLTTKQENHHVPMTTTMIVLGDSEIRANYSVADCKIFPLGRATFFLDVSLRLPDLSTRLRSVWPMAFRLDLGPHTLAIRRDWTIEVVYDPGARGL